MMVARGDRVQELGKWLTGSEKDRPPVMEWLSPGNRAGYQEHSQGHWSRVLSGQPAVTRVVKTSVTCALVRSLSCTPETSITLCVNDTQKTKTKNQTFQKMLESTIVF